LDNEQKRVISAPLAKSHLILGPPGSGKSNLLLLRADYIQRAGYPNSIILVFTKQLQSFMCAGSNHYSFPNTKIRTSFSWTIELLRSYDIFPEISDDFQTTRKQLCSLLSDTIKKRQIKNIYEFILLDEAQDYLPEELESYISLAKHLFAVGDNNQKIYDGDNGLDFLKKHIPSVFNLRHHYRNGVKICRLADGIAKQTENYISLESTSNYNENIAPSSVDNKKYCSIEELTNNVMKGLSLQLKAYPNEFIGVLTPRHEELRILSQFFQSTELYQQGKIQLRTDSTNTIEETRPIIISTMHSAKGLEFRALHLCFLEYVKKFKKNRNICFTGVTRGKTALYIHYINELPGYFEQALANLEKPPILPSVEELFIRKDIQ
jgi:superfamily I DNA/RNA helicase